MKGFQRALPDGSARKIPFLPTGGIFRLSVVNAKAKNCDKTQRKKGISHAIDRPPFSKGDHRGIVFFFLFYSTKLKTCRWYPYNRVCAWYAPCLTYTATPHPIPQHRNIPCCKPSQISVKSLYYHITVHSGPHGITGKNIPSRCHLSPFYGMKSQNERRDK